MFTGIVTHIGIVEKLDYLPNKDLLFGLKLDNDLHNNDIKRTLEKGCSIACNGVCLTLIDRTISTNQIDFIFQVSAETLQKTNIKSWKIGDKINLEFALKVGDELGGHLVSGHIDGEVKLQEMIKVNNDSWRFLVAMPKDIRKFIANKGSVVLNGVSLTVNEVFDDCFSVNIIPHTFNNTNLGNLQVGDYLNLEVDLIARYLSRNLEVSSERPY